MSGYAFALPDWDGEGKPGTKLTDETLDALGADIFFDGDLHVHAGGDFVLVEGLAAMRQAIYHRLLTKPGEYKRNPNYGVGVMSYVKRRRTRSVLDHLRGRIIDQLSLDRRIDEVLSVVVENITDGVKIAIKVRVAGEALTFRPFEFTERPLTVVGGNDA